MTFICHNCDRLIDTDEIDYYHEIKNELFCDRCAEEILATSTNLASYVCLGDTHGELIA